MSIAFIRFFYINLDTKFEQIIINTTKPHKQIICHIDEMQKKKCNFLNFQISPFSLIHLWQIVHLHSIISLCVYHKVKWSKSRSKKLFFCIQLLFAEIKWKRSRKWTKKRWQNEMKWKYWQNEKRDRERKRETCLRKRIVNKNIGK